MLHDSALYKFMINIDIELLVNLEELLSFLRASAMLKHVIDIGWTSVRPSVRPSHAGTVLYQNG